MPLSPVLGMAGLRFLSGLCEFAGGLLMLYYWQPRAALKINAVMGLFGPLVFLGVSALGVTAVRGELPLSRLLLLGLGVILIFVAVR